MSTLSRVGPSERPGEITSSAGEEATERLVGSLLSRRSLIKRGALGGGVLASAGLYGALAAEAAQAHRLRLRRGVRAEMASATPPVLLEPDDVTPAPMIFEIATIAEQIAVTLYEEAVEAAGRIGFSASELEVIKAAGIEEQIHHDFFLAVLELLGESPGKTIGPTTFFFPAGTFDTVAGFVETQQQLEGVFDSAFLSAIRELSAQGLHRAAQIAGQVAVIESEHRALGRQIAVNHGVTSIPRPFKLPLPSNPTQVFNLPQSNPVPDPLPTSPADDWAFAPVFIEAVKHAPELIMAAGFFGGNPVRHHYEAIDFTSSTYSSVFARVFFREPIINLGTPGH